MEMELEPMVMSLPYKIKGMPRESPTQKALHVLDTDHRSHWSTGTNTKEWILLELEEPCLLSQIQIYNKSVLEWEIAVGLRYKPEAFVKIRPRCEAPRRDMLYPTNYTPCRYVRISCLRGNPIAIFFIQLIGVSVTGLEPEFQPVVNYLLPHIIAHKQDGHNMHLQLLRDMTNRLLVFMPQLEADLISYPEAAESNTRFFAMLAGPFYPILHIVNEREAARVSGNFPDLDGVRSNQPSPLTVSSNFEAQPRRSRGSSPFLHSALSSIVFRPDTVFMLLRRAYRDSHLGTVCRTAARALLKLIEPSTSLEAKPKSVELTSSVYDEISRADSSNYILADYSSLFEDEFKIFDDQWDSNYLNVLDVAAVEEGIIHVLYACASQPLLCRKMAENSSEIWSVLPLLQALLPALRPPINSLPDHVDDNFSQWKHPFVQQALSQIIATSSSSVYRPLLHACAGYLSSFSLSHAKAACILIDLCSGPLAPWISTVIAKADLTIELLEDLLGTIQGARRSITRARAALKYIILAISGHVDDVLPKYKEAKHKVLFLVEMLEPFLDPAITAVKNTFAFGDVSSNFLEKQEDTCATALNVIRTAVWKTSVLPSLEAEWRRGSVAPSVLLSILGPHMPLPSEIDLCKCSVSKTPDQETSSTLHNSSTIRHSRPTLNLDSHEEFDEDGDIFEAPVKVDSLEDASLLFAPPELKSTALRNLANFLGEQSSEKHTAESNHDVSRGGKHLIVKKMNNQSPDGVNLDIGFSNEYFNLQYDFLQLLNHRDCEIRSSEFRRLALELHSQQNITPEGHVASIDALLLAAECYVNPFFMATFRANPAAIINQINICEHKIPLIYEIAEIKNVFEKKNNELEMIDNLERQRDMNVLQILFEAAEFDRDYHTRVSEMDTCSYESEGSENCIKISSLDEKNADAVTLVRRNQALLCRFLIQQLQKERNSMHEVLMQSLLFLLHSATELSCPPEQVIDILLKSAEYLNSLLTSFYYQLKEGNLQLDQEKVHGIQRGWVILQRLIIASSTGDEGPEFNIGNNGFQHRSLIPASSWMQRISSLCSGSCPLVRFLGWMAISRYAKQYLKERLFLVSDLAQLTNLLSIFGDELALVDNIVKDETMNLGKRLEVPDQTHGDRSFRVIYPDLHKFFPSMKNQFISFGEIILEAVGLQLRSLPSRFIPDVLCWFSDLCLWPFFGSKTSEPLKGFAAKNAKAIIIYLLEAIIVEHMEAMVPEIPRVVQVLVSLCKTSYCDVGFLDSILHLLKPLISYALKKVSEDEKVLTDDSSCLTFESLCFEELCSYIKFRTEGQMYQGSLAIFVLGVLFPDLSFARKRETLLSLMPWVEFINSDPTTTFYDYLCAYQKVMESCRVVLVRTLQEFNVPFPIDYPHLPAMSSNLVFEGTKDSAALPNQKYQALSTEEIEEFSQTLESLIEKLYQSIERCWKLHPQLVRSLTVTSATCVMYSSCLSYIVLNVPVNKDHGSENLDDFSSNHWKSGLEGLVGSITILQQNHCWQVASIMVDYLLGLPQCFCLDSVIGTICTSIMNFCCYAPRISWRLRTDKWLSVLLARGISSVPEDGFPLVDLLYTMLSHPEPEQKSVALEHIRRILGQDSDFQLHDVLVPSDLAISVSEPVLSFLVSKTWDLVALLATSDPSIRLRIRALAVLVHYTPFADREQLQSFLGSADNFFHGLGKLAYSVCESPLTKLLIALLAITCLHSSPEDIAFIPQSVWSNLEALGMSNSGGGLGDMEKKACQALCKLRIECDGAKEDLKKVLSTSYSSPKGDSEFGSARESILQVVGSLTSVEAYFDIFLKRKDKEVMELEEAEVELELLQKEKALHKISGHSREKKQHFPFLSSNNLCPIYLRLYWVIEIIRRAMTVFRKLRIPFSPSSAPSEKVHIPPTAAKIYAKEKTRVFKFLAGLNPDFEYACVHLLDKTPFPILEEAHAYCLSDQSRRSPMPPISGILSETSAMAIRYAYPAPPSVPSQTSHTLSPSLSPLPTASGNSGPSRKKCDYYGRQPPTPDCQASSVAPGLPPAIDSPLSGIEHSPTASILVTTDDDSPVSHSDDDRPIAIQKEKRNAGKPDRYSDAATQISYEILWYSSSEKSRIREEIAARRQKKLLVRRSRQKFLEDTALEEAELLQELDRERASEAKQEIERQHLLEFERAKTSELRHNLDMEKERQVQRELQRELEQTESGLRPSRREFSSATPSRPRDRYRDKESGRSQHEGNLRPNSSDREGVATLPAGLASPMPNVVMGGSRSFSGQLPTILQPRERIDERSLGGGSYEESFDGSKDSGDTGSFGESELASAFDGQTGNYGSSQRPGSRGNKPRQIIERREREGGRREGKWERKH
ncbi:hypothetical protein GIB67_021427 [Kingdonia uniflora]|uniref:Uncharacterized protein n=1 Tax=Kingdonia uniflora TaxID=39325 RepID=A0A7J7NR42_9MAGN|nr:hypothetical protein GIB67_021427 [Kingdonia uniflora]